MKIAIVGAGYAGLSLALAFLARDPLLKITIYHEHPLDESASSISTGLLYPYVGKFTKRNWKGKEGMEAAKKLLNLSQKSLGEQVFLETGLLKVCYKPFQKNNCRRVARKRPINSWHEASSFFHQKIIHPSLYMPEGITVFSPFYIKGLVKACIERGVVFFQKKIQSTSQLAQYDRIILCAGAGLVEFKEAKDLPVERVKGQTLVLKWPDNLPKLSQSLVSEKHLVLCKDPQICQLGSTYEKNFQTQEADINSLELKEKVGEFFPEIKKFAIVGSRAAVRLSRVGSYVPLTTHLQKNIWVFGALGSRGLLYHAYLAQVLADDILGSVQN